MQQPAFLEGVDPHVKWLVITLAILIPFGAAHNIMTDAPDALGEEGSFAMCDYSLNCEGVEAGDMCLGIESWSVQCVDPQQAAAWRHAEAECGLDAQGLCNADSTLSGTEWAEHPNASYDGTRCTEWSQMEERVTLLTCEDTFNDITQWTE